jgi:hypothetical protein
MGSSEDRIRTNANATLPYPWWYELYKRLKLFRWWLRYNVGVVKEAVLKDRIIELTSELGLQDRWVRRIVRHAVSEFSKKGLGPDYYGYHTIEHELEATYFTILAAKGQKDKFSYKDLNYLFVSALFHDFDPLKEFDKPNEEKIEWFLRHDERIMKFIEEAGINIDIVMALIHRTAYPFDGEIKENAEKRMQDLFTAAGIPEDDLNTRKHYEELGWFLSVSERIAGYALGDFDRSVELAQRNAHALAWHPSVINMESVKYFSVFKREIEMVDRVLGGVGEEYRRRFDDNIARFKEEWAKEMEIRGSVTKKQITLVPVVEGINAITSELYDKIFELYSSLPPPLRVEEENFRRSLARKDTLLVTLKVNDRNGTAVGYAKGGPLEYYRLRRGTDDENLGKRNTLYLEAMSIESGYWDGGGGHLLRLKFLQEAKKRGYKYVSAYAHRNVIERRMMRVGEREPEPIQLVRKYDPDRLDYYRLDLSRFPFADELQPQSRIAGRQSDDRFTA